jgi:hypothetical protein
MAHMINVSVAMLVIVEKSLLRPKPIAASEARAPIVEKLSRDLRPTRYMQKSINHNLISSKS